MIGSISRPTPKKNCNALLLRRRRGGRRKDIARPVVQSSAEFTRNYIPPDYLIDGLLQRQYVYSLTARTGSGKTAIAFALAAHVAMGRPLGEREVEKGRVLMFAGENADDVCARWIVLGENMGFDVETVDVHFVPGRFNLLELIEKIRTEVEALGGCALLIIDTSAAYFAGDNENDNVQLGQHASNMRELRIPGGPCTLINCHPPKNPPMTICCLVVAGPFSQRSTVI